MTNKKIEKAITKIEAAIEERKDWNELTSCFDASDFEAMREYIYNSDVSFYADDAEEENALYALVRLMAVEHLCDYEVEEAYDILRYLVG